MSDQIAMSAKGREERCMLCKHDGNEDACDPCQWCGKDFANWEAKP